MLLIGLGSRARQGKNFVANYMQEMLPDIKFYSFADELKKYCRDNHNELLTQWQLANQTKQTPKQKDDPIYGYGPILQWYGSDVVRKHEPNHWVNIIEQKLNEDNPDIAIITDVRFPNEADWVKSHDGYLVEVIRLNEDGSRYYDPNRDKNHISETALDEYNKWDFLILCKSGNLNSLRHKARAVLTTILDIERDDSHSIADSTGYSGN